MDDLQPQTRKFLKTITMMVKEFADKSSIDAHEVRFSRRELRHYSGLGDNRVHIHLQRLVKYEYLSQNHVPGTNRHVYELLYGCEEETEPSAFAGLVDVDLLKKRLESSEPSNSKG